MERFGLSPLIRFTLLSPYLVLVPVGTSQGC